MNDLDKFLNEVTYSKKKHFEFFTKSGCDLELFGFHINSNDCDLKVYQDLLSLYFLKKILKPGFKMLEIGGGESRIIQYFKKDFECWNLDKLEGIGNGPLDLKVDGYFLIQDYIGKFNKNLPENYFDVVFSISALEHVPIDETCNKEAYKNILTDINRLLCIGGISFHCIDHTTDLLYETEEELWTNPIITYFFKNEKMLNKFVPLKLAENDPDLFFVSENFYNIYWKPVTGKEFKDFGKPFSYNLFWKKS